MMRARPDTILAAINAAQESKYPFSARWGLPSCSGTYIMRQEWEAHSARLIAQLMRVYEEVSR